MLQVYIIHSPLSPLHQIFIPKCSGFTLVVNLFNKDDAEDGGLSFFYSAETQSTNYLDTRLSPSLRLSLAERERTHLTPSAAN